MATPMIEVKAVTKRFGSVNALAGVGLTAGAGTVLGLLGPNGAGKTTLVRILSTLLKPDSGQATIAGYDVVRDAQRLRSMIGLAGQYAAVDELLTGRENLELVGRLYHVGRAERRRRAQEVLERFSLTEAGDRQVKTYSGGMRRRLDLGASLVGHPSVLILDEPTTGLDPRTRSELWTLIEQLVTDGTTVVLTTQYLEEAERLAHQIVVIDRGRVVAAGTADELKTRAGGAVLEARVVDPGDLHRVAALLTDLGDGPPQLDTERRRVAVPTGGGAKVL
ncbi:ATP-binding cassette domain-containing protein, partial [Frankia sp. CiP3]